MQEEATTTDPASQKRKRSLGLLDKQINKLQDVVRKAEKKLKLNKVSFLFLLYTLQYALSFICPFISQEALAAKEKERQQLIGVINETEQALLSKVIDSGDSGDGCVCVCGDNSESGDDDDDDGA